MIDYVTLAARLELPAHRITAFLSADVELEGGSGTWRTYFERAAAEGRLDAGLGAVRCVEDLLDYLDLPSEWSQRWKDEGTFEVLANTGDGDPWLLRTSLLAMVLEGAAKLGGRGYLYLLDAMHRDEQVPLNLHMTLGDGQVVETELDVELAWRVRDRVESTGLWPALEDGPAEDEPGL